MHAEEIRDYCLAKPGVTEGLPFGDDTLVFKVMGKIFVLMNLDGELRLNLKCDPGYALELREHYSCVIPGYHMNKKHWNTIVVSDVHSVSLLHQWIDHSYEQVVAGLGTQQKQELDKLK